MDRISECGLALAAAEHDGARLPARRVAGCRAALAASFAQTASWLLGTSGPAPDLTVTPDLIVVAPDPPDAPGAQGPLSIAAPEDGADAAVDQVEAETRYMLDVLSAARAAMMPGDSPDAQRPGAAGSSGPVPGNGQLNR
jgi:hypothetical protein